MRVFVTGATGYIGSAVVRELVHAGHKVVGLTRSGSSAAMLKEVGVEIHHGALDDLDSLPSGAASENEVKALAKRGARTSIVSLAPFVHGEGDKGFVPRLINIARDKGVSAYIGDGSNHWTAVHRLDAAHLFRLALEKAPAGSRLDGVADEGVPFRDIASVIGKHLNLPVVSISRDEAESHFGFLGIVAALDIPRSSVQTQELLGWHPLHRGLMADLEQGHYFNS